MEPKVLFYDIETGGVNAFKADLGFILCFGYKWLGDPRAYCLTLDQFDGFQKYKFDDSGLLKRALQIMEEADILVGHFADRFDRRFLQGRCLINGLPPPPPTKQRDTCLLARKAFCFSSNRLGHLSKILKLKHQKLENGWPDWWLEVLAGNKAVLKKMASYCKGDVRALEELYLKIRPYDYNHPRIIIDRTTCSLCGSQVEYRGYTHVGLYRYRRYVCHNCGKWSRETKRISDS